MKTSQDEAMEFARRLNHRMLPWMEVKHYNAEYTRCVVPGCYAMMWAEDDRVEGSAFDDSCVYGPREAVLVENPRIGYLEDDVQRLYEHVYALEDQLRQLQNRLGVAED